MPIDLNDLPIFAAVVRHQGFSAAAKELGVPASSVSRRVARLEGELGFKLLHRTTRKVGLTEAGRLFFERTSMLPHLVEDAVRAVSQRQNAPGGQLRVTAPPDDGGILWRLLEGFVQAHPEVDLHLTHTLDRVDLIEEEIDVALRGGPPPDTTLYVARKLFESRLVLVASPAYLASRGTPAHVEELAGHDGICMDPWAPNAIRRIGGDRGYARVSMRNRIRANSLETAQRAALAGLGIAPLLELTCGEALADGRLVEILRGALPEEAPFWAIAPLGRQRSAAADALLEHVVHVARTWEAPKPR